MGYLKLSYFQVALAAALIFLNAGLSLWLRLRLERALLIGAFRTVTQLLLVGLVLQWVFSLNRWYIVIAVMALMTVLAGTTAVQRMGRRYPGIWLNSLLSIWASSWLMTAYAVFAVLHLHPWYSPQYTIPLLGMILGNSLSGVTLALDRLGEELSAKRGEVESRLALGATSWEAASTPIAQAVRTGCVPIINSMMVAGLVSLPGMMTGQLLSGTSPLEAVKYQVVIMFLIAAATMLGTLGVSLLGYRRLFSHRHQFLYQRLQWIEKRRSSA